MDAKKVAIGVGLKKATDIEVKYRLVNVSTVEGYDWYGDVYVNKFNFLLGDKDWSMIDYKWSSETKTYQLITPETIFQEGLFMKDSDTPFYTRERKAEKVGFKMNLTKEDVLNTENLPKKDVDKRK